MPKVRIALVGDFSVDVVAHSAIQESMRLAAGAGRVEPQWLHTSMLQPGNDRVLASFHGVWCVPNSPYANTAGALWAIEWARTRNVPFLGTCGGFQHALLEFVRNVLGRRDAAHAESEPGAELALIAPLTCPLVEKSDRVVPTGRGRFAEWYGAKPRDEGFSCSFGLNAAFEALLHGTGLEIVARSEGGEVRAVELAGREFFVGTLFQPERAALRGELHPIVAAFLAAAAQRGGAS